MKRKKNCYLSLHSQYAKVDINEASHNSGSAPTLHESRVAEVLQLRPEMLRIGIIHSQRGHVTDHLR